MKAKKLEKKLALNKNTVTNLTQEQLEDIKGGVSARVCRQHSWYHFCEK